MKSWAKKPFTKAALSVIAVGMSIIVCLSGVMLSMFLCTYLNMQLQEPPMMEVLEMRDGDSEVKVMEIPLSQSKSAKMGASGDRRFAKRTESAAGRLERRALAGAAADLPDFDRAR